MKPWILLSVWGGGDEVWSGVITVLMISPVSSHPMTVG